MDGKGPHTVHEAMKTNDTVGTTTFAKAKIKYV